MAVAEVAVAPHDSEVVLSTVLACWGTVHVELAEALHSYKMTLVVTEIPVALHDPEAVLACWKTGNEEFVEVVHSYWMMVVVAEVAAPSNLEMVLCMEPASWGTVRTGLAEALTLLQRHEMTGVVAEVDAAPSNLEVVLSMVPGGRETGQGLGLA